MTIRFGLLICAVLSLLASAALGENEAPRSNWGNDLAAQVTIPYQEFKRLLDATTAGKLEDSPDLPGAVTRAVIKLSFDPAHPAGEAEFDISTFGHRWVFVPFFGLNLPSTNVACENAAIVPRYGVLCLLTNHPGSTKVTLDFDIPSSLLNGRGEAFSMQLAPVTSGELEFSNVPSAKRILVAGNTVDTSKPLPLLPQGGELKIKCVADNAEVSTVWSQTTQTLVKLTLDSIQIESHIHLSSESGSGLSAAAELPVTASKLVIAGADLQSAQINLSRLGRRKILLTWETTRILERNIIVSYELKDSDLDGSLCHGFQRNRAIRFRPPGECRTQF
jgi:hypothetical protein